MNDSTRGKYDQIIRMSYPFFQDRPCTEDGLDQFYFIVQNALDNIRISKEQLYSDLERRHNISVLDSSVILDDNSDHIEWFNPSTNAGLDRDLKWHFWDHYRNYLSYGKRWPSNVVENLDNETSQILSRLEDPERAGAWDRRGMVMGSVQSGKTANYTGLIAKAIDAGYKLIIVLAGVHNSLRSQTQFRINEELMGYDLDQVQRFTGQSSKIGVRSMFSDHRIIQTLTSSNEQGDFKKVIADSAGIIPSQNGDPTVLIVKKHVSILKNLIEWSTAIIGEEDDSGRQVVADVPLLVIDDECDYASVNTKKVVLDENGAVEEDCDPAKTNQRIREILCSFWKSAYIGYTATPFANIFIHFDQMHPTYGEDLFPRNFIFSLPQPTNYVGPDKVFGLYENWVEGEGSKDPLPLLRSIWDSPESIPDRHKKEWEVPELPDSLINAIRSFLLVSAVRHIRKSSPPHNSMLVHVTRYTNVQKQIGDLVEKELRYLVGRIQNKNDDLKDLRELWNDDFVQTTIAMKDEFQCDISEWEEILDVLYKVARRIKVKLINGEASDVLDYRYMDMRTRERIGKGEEVPWEERGEYVIAVGGDKLSRGLTLDGLTISYYLRASRMYDTLMQMGRWFGYRDGYIDLCRIYTTDELIEWYRHIATASLELRHELDYMALLNKEPQEFGLKVLSHPGQLAITSAGKRRNAETIKLKYSGTISETVSFDPSFCAENQQHLCNFIANLESANGLPQKQRNYHWRDVDWSIVVEFLRNYRLHEGAVRTADPRRWADFIEMQVPQNELTSWSVVVAFPASATRSIPLSGTKTKKINCSVRKGRVVNNSQISIGRLLDPADEWLDLPEELVKATWIKRRKDKGLHTDTSKMRPGPIVRELRPKERGMMLIYVIYSDKEGVYGLESGDEAVGVGISFPESDTAIEVEYLANSVYQDAEN